MSAVDKLKADGNAAFNAKSYQKAIELYTEAIDMDSSNHTLYSNRSGAYCAAGKYKAAIADARKAIEIKPDWPRGHTRLGAALEGDGDFDGAIKSYEEAHRLDPSNQQIEEDLQNVKQKAAQPQGGMGMNNLFTPEVLASIYSNPKIMPLLSDPSFQTMIKDLQADPKKNFQKYQNDPRLMTVMEAILEPMMRQRHEEPESKGKEEQPTQNAKTEEVPKPAPKTAASPNEEAENEKNLGNELFKAGNLEEALRHYDRAIELDQKNVFAYTNKATVLTKMGRNDEAIELCKKAIAIGRENHASYEAIAKAYTKIASAEAARDNLDAAIDALNSSLIEKSDPMVKRELKRLSDLQAKRKAKAYENPELSEKAKNEGNEAFRNKDFPKAIESYSEAIKRSPMNPTLYSNRAAAYSKLGEMPMAIKDCDKALEIDPNFAKAYTRKGYCHYMMKEYYKAQECYNSALKIDPNNADAIDGQQSVNAAIAKQRYTAPDEEQIKRAMADPEIQKIIQDPGMQQILKDIQENPSSAQNYLSNPNVREALLKLQAAGILR